MSTTTIEIPMAEIERALERRRKPGSELLEPRVAAVELLPAFRCLARRLAPDDRSTQDDLAQEMALGALTLSKPQAREMYLILGSWRATNYLEWWRGPMFKVGDKRKGGCARVVGKLRRVRRS
jgi:hypothetical protein